MNKIPRTSEDIAKWATVEAENGELADHEKFLQVFNAIPLGAGTVSERKVLAIKLMPEARMWTVRRICNVAKMSRPTWYAVHKSERFSDVCREFCRQIKGTYLPQVLQAFVQNAIDGNVTAQIKLLEEGAVFAPEKSDVNIIQHFNPTGTKDADGIRGNLAAIIGNRNRFTRFAPSDN